MIQRTTVKTPLGLIGLAVSETGVTAIDLGAARRTRKKHRATVRPGKEDRRTAGLLADAQAQLEEYFSGKRRAFSIPVDLSAGTAFQRKVWRAITRIPFGRVRSYRWVAARVGGKQYARAVGMALGANPVPIVIPCHRVIAQDGSLGGFSCGLPIKRRLLKLEGTLA